MGLLDQAKSARNNSATAKTAVAGKGLLAKASSAKQGKSTTGTIKSGGLLNAASQAKSSSALFSTGASIATIYDKLLDMILSNKDMSIVQVATSLNIPVSSAESMANILMKEGLITVYYPFVGPGHLADKSVIKKDENVNHKSRNLIIFTGAIVFVLVLFLILVYTGIITLGEA